MQKNGKRDEVDGEVERQRLAQKVKENVGMLIEKVHRFEIGKAPDWEESLHQSEHGRIEEEDGEGAEEGELEAEL